MKDRDCRANNNATAASAVVATGTTFASSSSSISIPTLEEACGLVCRQVLPRGVRDLHSSSDTDDCDLDIGIGRLVIDLEADPDTKARCPPSTTLRGPDMKSSGGLQKTTLCLNVSGNSGTSCTQSSGIAAGNSLMEGTSHLGRSAKSHSVVDGLKPSHRPLNRNNSSSGNSVPVTSVVHMSTALSDLADKGIKMRIKCNQQSQSALACGSVSKHEVMQFHSPSLSSTPGNGNPLTVTAESPNHSGAKVISEKSSHCSSSINKSNCGRTASNKKERHSTKDRSRPTNSGRSTTETIVANATATIASNHSNCPLSGGQESVDLALKVDVTLNDSEIANIPTSSNDPYEFNMKIEDTVGLPLKKIKLDRCDTASSPIVELFQPESEKSKDVGLDACHIGTITEPDCFGPCEPGTSVTLEGIVWNETENGLLVVNVTWRGKTYVGTLMDATKHHWAPPRFSGDSPTSDFETRTPKGRGKRGRTCAVPQRNEGNGSDRKLRSNRSSKPAAATAAPSPVRNDTNSLKRSRTETGSSDGSRGSKCSRSDSRTSDVGNGSAGTNGEVGNGGMIECPEENCSKKYRNLNGLRYHQTRAHKSTCAALAKETHDIEASKYMNDDFVDNSGTVIERSAAKTKPVYSEVVISRKPVPKSLDTDSRAEETLEEMELVDIKLTVDGVVSKEGGLTDGDIFHGKASSTSELLPKAEVATAALASASEDLDLQGNRTMNKGITYASVCIEESKKIGVTQQPLITLTPVSVPSKMAEDSVNTSMYQMLSASIGSTNAIAFMNSSDSLAVSILQDVPILEEAKSQSSNEQSKSDGSDKGKKSKSDKLDRNKTKPSVSSVPRPVASAAFMGAMKPALIEQQASLQTISTSSQLKPIQPKPVTPSEQINVNPTVVATVEKPKKRKRDKEKPKDHLVLNGPKEITAIKPTLENTEDGHQPMQSLLAPAAGQQLNYVQSATGQLISTPVIPVAVTSSSDIFCQPKLVTSDPGHVVGQPDLIPMTVHHSPGLGVLPPQFSLHQTSIEQSVLVPQSGHGATGECQGVAALSNVHLTLPPPSPDKQQPCLMHTENVKMRPIVVNLPSPLTTMKAVPSSVIKNTSSFDIGTSVDLPVEPKSSSATDGDHLNQAPNVLMLPGNNEFTSKTGEAGSKASDGPVSSPNPSMTSTSPCRKVKTTPVKHGESSGLADFVDPHSPAYSDISDANDNVPLLDAPMLEKEAQAAADEEEAIGSKVSPSHPQDSYVYSPFYGQPPCLTPAVPSSDVSDCSSILKPTLNKPSEKHLGLEKAKVDVSTEKRPTDSVTMRSRPSDVSLKFSSEQPMRDEKEGREKCRTANSGLTADPGRSDLHKSQLQQHKMFSPEMMSPQQQAAMMTQLMIPSSFAFSGVYGYFPPEHMGRMFQHQLQQQDARRQEQAVASKAQPEGADHSKIRQPIKSSTDGKHSEDKFKSAKYEGPLPTPPSLIPDRNRHDLKEEVEKIERNREKQIENRKLTKEGIEIKNLMDIGGAKSEGYDIKTLSERSEMPRYCLQSHFLEQQQRLTEHQPHRSLIEQGVGGCKPSAVVAPQTREKNTLIGGIISSSASVTHGAKQREDSQGGRGHESHRSHRDSQKTQLVTPPQQQHKSSTGGCRDSISAGRTSKEPGERASIKDESGQSSARGVASKGGKEEGPVTSLPVSLPTGIPASYAPYYGHYLSAAPYAGPMPFDPSHAATLYPGMMGYSPYLHTTQILSPALAMASADGKPCDMLSQAQPSPFFSSEGHAHKIHELKEVAKMQQGDGSQPSPSSRDSTNCPKSSRNSHLSGKDNDHSSPPTQRHLHTHHHMHVLGPSLYPFVNSESAMMASQQAAATAAAQIPRPFLAK